MAKTLDTSIDGGYDLEQTRSALSLVEAGGWRLTSLAQAPHTFVSSEDSSLQRVNYASFERLGPTEVAPELILVLLQPNDSIGSTVAQQLAAGRNLVTYGSVFVKGKVERVASFR